MSQDGLDAPLLNLLHRAGVKPRQLCSQPVEADIYVCKFVLGYSGEIGRKIKVSLEGLNCRFYLAKDFLLFSGNIADSLRDSVPRTSCCQRWGATRL